MQLFKRLNAEGTTIVQVTHSETNAAHGNRIVQLRDGWIVDSIGGNYSMILASFTQDIRVGIRVLLKDKIFCSSLHPRARTRALAAR